MKGLQILSKNERDARDISLEWTNFTWPFLAFIEHIQRFDQIFYPYKRMARGKVDCAILISFRSVDLLRILFCSPAASVIFQRTLFYIFIYR